MWQFKFNTMDKPFFLKRKLNKNNIPRENKWNSHNAWNNIRYKHRSMLLKKRIYTSNAKLTHKTNLRWHQRVYNEES